MKEAFIGCIGSVINEVGVSAESMAEMERALKQMLHEVGGVALGRMVEACDEKYAADEQRCECG
ncbi:MAG: hypothetical protein ACYDBJ_20475, partial [Aggregatilineales bacterium]